ncbi:hypothetical protein MML48_4g00015190 [Holotrichia oblita]|uniref:Uncharacterized protein n=1 Tax=Holotrichia oblita TaxID=644536 RepID=A0ACB9TAD0_HOLOL|nr:hypothetical protein MML48_4g00015190 [Holotrichia oblita]
MLFVASVILLSLKVVVAAPTTSCNTSDSCNSQSKPLPNYYWRKYEGVIPKDAIPGGYTPSGTITYIGQVLAIGRSENALIPGTIHPDKEDIVAPFDGAFRSKQYVAILCTDRPQDFKWRQVSADEVNLIKEYLVVGGYDKNEPAFIGRVSYFNHLIVGKVLMETLYGLKIVTPKDIEARLTKFEILVYEPTTSSTLAVE